MEKKEVGEWGGKASSMLAPAAPALAHHNSSVVPLSLFHGRWVLGLSLRTEKVPAPPQGHVNIRHWVKPHNSPRAMFAYTEKLFFLSTRDVATPADTQCSHRGWAWPTSPCVEAVLQWWGCLWALHQCVFPQMSMEANILGVAGSWLVPTGFNVLALAFLPMLTTQMN